MNPVVALEIGTTKTLALVGDVQRDGNIMIIGTGETSSIGVRKGEIIDIEQAATSVRLALQQAEETSDVNIREVNLAVSGNGIRSTVGSGSVPVSSDDQLITKEHIKAVMEISKAISIPADHNVIHTIPQHYWIDDNARVTNPEDMTGAKLSLDVLLVHGIRNRIKNSVQAVHAHDIDVGNVYFTALCSAVAILTQQQKLSGVLLLDFGGGTAGYAAYADSMVARAGSISIGGDHITNDIAYAFNIPHGKAEILKKESGSALVNEKAVEEKIAIPAEVGFSGRSVSRLSLCKVINARIEETFLLLKRELESYGLLDKFGAGIVMTGGCARLHGICDVAEQVFGLPCSIGCAINIDGVETVQQSPEYSACAGVIQNAIRSMKVGQKKTLFGSLFGRR